MCDNFVVEFVSPNFLLPLSGVVSHFYIEEERSKFNIRLVNIQ